MQNDLKCYLKLSDAHATSPKSLVNIPAACHTQLCNVCPHRAATLQAEKKSPTFPGETAGNVEQMHMY